MGPSLELQVLVLGGPGLLHLHTVHAPAFGQNGETWAVLGPWYCLRTPRWVEEAAADPGLQRGRAAPSLHAHA